MRGLAAFAVLLLLGPAAALAEDWDPAEVAAAERLRADETARAAEYRRRVARGDVRSRSAPRARAAPSRGERRGMPGDLPPEAVDLADLLERWFGGGRIAQEAEEPPRPERGEQRRERAPADDWWAEEERRLEEGR